jgi:hypothetical protein
VLILSLQQLHQQAAAAVVDILVEITSRAYQAVQVAVLQTIKLTAVQPLHRVKVLQAAAAVLTHHTMAAVAAVRVQ